MIVSLANLKGGVGKTSSTMHLAAVASAAGHDVLVLDSDNEHSAVAWAHGAELPFDVLPASVDTLEQEVERAAGKTVFVDTPPNSRDHLVEAAMLSDVVLVPVLPSMIDAQRLASTLNVLKRLPDVDVRLLIVQHNKGRVLSRELIELLEDKNLLESKISNLEIYRRQFGQLPEFLDEYESVWRELQK